jgi:hypothetical protein
MEDCLATGNTGYTNGKQLSPGHPCTTHHPTHSMLVSTPSAFLMLGAFRNSSASVKSATARWVGVSKGVSRRTSKNACHRDCTHAVDINIMQPARTL